MFDNLSKLWNKYGLEFLAGVSIFVIIVLFLINYFTKEKGTYANFKIIENNPNISNNNYKSNEYMQHTEKDSKLELLAKFHLENIFKRPFLKIRPDFLQNNVTRKNLELDLYNEELKLAIEVQGNQHYKFTPFFHKNKETFLNQRYRDEMKKEKCKKYGITLIEIPYRVGEKGLKPYLIEKLRLEGFLI